MNFEEKAYTLIKGWHGISSGEKVESVDVFFQFMASWVSFNALYNWYSKNKSISGDKKKLKCFASDNEKARNVHKELLDENDSYRNSVGVLKARGIIDVTTNKPVLITDETNFEQVVLCVYQVRNNLFHGDKLVGNDRDEQVVSASYTIISSILRKYLNATSPYSLYE